METYNNVFYQSYINRIGGVESVIYNISRLYSDKDITIVYKEANSEQLYRLSKYARLIQYKGQKIHCKRLFVNYGWFEIKDTITADEKYWVVHANYKYINSNWDEKLDIPNDFKVLAVSDYAGGNCGRKDYRVCPNPVIVDDRDLILIVSATRLAIDKGGIKERMQILANYLTTKKVHFLWLVFSDSNYKIENPNVVHLPSRLDIMPYLKKADFVAQLSDSEACCMTALESECLGTPMLVTKVPSFYEQGLNDDNAIFFDFDMLNIDECVDKMIHKKFDFKFTPKKEIWGELLIGKREEELKPMKMFKVKATSEWNKGGGIVCNAIGRVPLTNEEFIVSEEEYDKYLHNSLGLHLVDLVEAMNDDTPKEEIAHSEPKKEAKKPTKKATKKK